VGKKMREAFFGFLNTLVGFVNGIFSLLSEVLRNYNDPSASGMGLNYSDLTSQYYGLFVIIGGGVLILLWGIGIMQTAVSNELFTMRGGVKTFGKFFLAFLLMSLAGRLCVYILDISNWITDIILDQDLAITVDHNYDSSWVSGPDIIIVGDVVDFLLSIVYLIPTLLMIAVVGIIAILISVKLMMRTFQLGILITISPCFFACTVSDSSMEYFKKFLNAFLSTAFEIVFMVMVYAAAKVWLLENSFFDHMIQWVVIIIAMGIMMIKPPQFLKSLV
jgi:hypothetical protein